MFRRAAMKVERPLPQTEAGPAPDRARLERMFRDHHELLWRMLRRRGLGPDAAADLAQQAFLIAAERLDAIHRGSERAFLIGTAVRLARSAYRRARLIELADDMDVHAARGGDVGDARSAIDLLDLVLSKIDPPLVEVFVLFELEELSMAEVVAIVGCPLQTGYSRLHAARAVIAAAAARSQSHD